LLIHIDGYDRRAHRRGDLHAKSSYATDTYNDGNIVRPEPRPPNGLKGSGYGISNHAQHLE
jgi:hypothetical protein